MPLITIPEDVTLVNTDGNPVTSQDGKTIKVNFVKSFLVDTITNDAKFGKSVQYLYAAMDIVAAFSGKVPGDRVLVSQDMWEKLKEVIKEPSVPYNTAVMKQCRTFFQAVLEPAGDN